VPNGSIGTPLANAVGYACWNVARLLVARGATVDTLWAAAALGLLERLEELLADASIATPENISQAFWHACGGGQRRAAERLLGLGADLNGVPDYAEKTPLEVAGGGGTQDSNVVEWLKHLGARSTDSDPAGGSDG
jgi:ankyrin repeat protein